jgi:hypothetical protein
MSKSTPRADTSDQAGRDDRLPHGGAPVRPCEFERAYAELITPRSRRPRGPVAECSPEGPEDRAYPGAPAGSPPYSLCNGHLRDLFAALEGLDPLPPGAETPRASLSRPVEGAVVPNA